MTEREQFEVWIKSPPFEHWCEKFDEKAVWPDHYKRYETQLAWEAWQARATPALPEGMAIVPVELLERVEKFAAEAAEHYSRMSDEVCQSYSDPWLEGVTVCKELRAIIEDKP